MDQQIVHETRHRSRDHWTRSLHSSRYAENVYDFVARWELFHWYVVGMCLLGYRFQLVCASAAHLSDEGNPAASQLRERVYLIFTRHHWGSWLVRGSFIIGAYGGVVETRP